MPTLDNILSKLKSLTALHVIHYNSFEGQPVLDNDHKVCLWNRSTLHGYMQSIGFVYENRISHYEHSKTRPEIVMMRDN